MRSLFLTASRFAVSAWVGAASLFVITSVMEATTADFTSEIKADLALLRFPAYYACGFVLVSLALVTGLLAKHSAIGSRRLWVYRVLLVLALMVMIVDYLAVYQPLAQMIARADEARPASFETYHLASQYINAGHVGTCLLAAVLVCWPAGKRTG